MKYTAKLFTYSWAAGVLCMALIVGCTTVTSTNPDGETVTKNVPDVPRIAAFTKEAVTIGVSEALLANPQWQPYFATCHQQLTVLEGEDAITVASLLNVLSQLPVKELNGQNARIAFSSARLVIVAAGWSDVGSEQMKQVRPIVVAIREGLELAGVLAQ